MTPLAKAELNRRAREWLHVETSDNEFNAAFESAKRRLITNRDMDADALMAVGEFAAIRSLLASAESPQELARLLGKYVAASGDDATARRTWPRIQDGFAQIGETADAQTLRALAHIAEALGDRDLAGAAARLAPTRPESENAFADPVTEFVYATLGYAPDAAKGRLRLRLRLPVGWTHLTVQNLRIGDALLRLTYTHAGAERRYEFEQFAGAIPITLILEALLDAPLASAKVDGTHADLNVAVVGPGVVVPVQIVLDAPRVVELAS